MQVTKEELNPCTVQLKIVCEPEQVQAGFEKAFKQISKSVKLPGFRPGHVPRAILEKHVAKADLYDAAAENIIRSAYKKAVTESDIAPDLSLSPSVDLTLLDQDSNACEFTVKVPLPPKIELGDYVGLPIEKPRVEVSDEEIDYQIDELRKRKQTREAVTDRGAQEGDVAVVNVRLEGDEGEGRNFMTVVGRTFPQLDQALLGMKLEDVKGLDLNFPENFQEKDWAGKLLKCQVSLNSISTVKLPELDDSFAQSLKTESVDELRARLRTQIERAKNDMVREMMSEQLLDKLLERSKVEVSDNMWEGIAAQRVRDDVAEQTEMGRTLEQVAAANGMTEEEFIESRKHASKINVMRALLIREVFAKEKMRVGDPDLNRELYAMANEYNVGAEEMLALLRKNSGGMNELNFRAVSRMVSDFLAEKAEVKEVVLA